MYLQEEIKRLENQIIEHEQLLLDPELSSLASEEIANLKVQVEALNGAINAMEATQQNGETASMDGKNATIEIRGGAGGDEAKIWSNDLMLMYTRFCELKKL